MVFFMLYYGEYFFNVIQFTVALFSYYYVGVVCTFAPSFPYYTHLSFPPQIFFLNVWSRVPEDSASLIIMLNSRPPTVSGLFFYFCKFFCFYFVSGLYASS